jgi:hypothetical protein
MLQFAARWVHDRSVIRAECACKVLGVFQIDVTTMQRVSGWAG